ncbi:MAG: hypothetical protein JWO22_1546, partial [Frankiales bacterium]|nr:hypothetical protein [Frankiales bacterium]
MSDPGWGLVLGGGGAVGTAYLAGVLAALQDVGVDLSTPGIVIGTSAGSLAAAQVRRGDAPADVLAVADVPLQESGDPGEHYERAWTTGRELSRRVLGSSAVVARSMLRVPLPKPSSHLEERFPGGLYRIRDSGRLRDVVGTSWPTAPLWLIAADLYTRHRRAFGSRPDDHEIPLTTAVRASCAVPGFYEPVRVGGHRYVDGGVLSTTSLDLAARFGCKRIVCVAPMGYEPGSGTPRGVARVMRRPAVRAIRDELRRARALGSEVLVVQPHVEDLELHG